MKRQVRWVSYGIAYALVAVSAAGCMNYLQEKAGIPRIRVQSAGGNSQGPAKPHTGVPDAKQGAQEFNLSGSWICDSNQCDTVKVISDKQDSIVTTSTVTDAKSLSVCRLQETAQLSVVSDEAGDDNVYVELTPTDLQLIDAADNSGDCGEVYEKPIPGEKRSSVLILELPEDDRIEIDGVKYRRASAQDLQAVSAGHAKASAQYNFDGNWSCIDTDHLGDELLISRSGKSITSLVNMKMDTNELCPIEQDMKITAEKTDSAHPESVVESVIPGTISPAVTDSDTCDNAINDWNQKNPGTSTQLIKLGLDGTQMLVVHGKHYVRKQ